MQTRTLWQLQEVDQSLAKISKEIRQKELVLSLKEKQMRINELQEILDKENYEITQLEKKAKKLEQELVELEEKRTQLEKKLYSGSSNVFKELEGMREKLYLLENKINQVEEKALGFMDQVEDKVQVINQKNGEIEKLKKDYAKGVRKYHLNKKNLEQSQTEFLAKKLELTKKINNDLIEKYNHLQERYKHTGIARVDGVSCSGCRIQIPILKLKSIKEGNNIEYCEHCGRILVC